MHRAITMSNLLEFCYNMSWKSTGTLVGSFCRHPVVYMVCQNVLEMYYQSWLMKFVPFGMLIDSLRSFCLRVSDLVSHPHQCYGHC